MSDAMDRGRGAIAWMAHNPVAANILMFLCVAGGLFSLLYITQEVFPEIESDTISVSVAYPGASPEEVEQGIVMAVEEAVTGLPGVEEVTSSAVEGSGVVVAKLMKGAEPLQAYQDILSAVDRITTLPEDAERPITKIDVRRRGVMAIAVYGDTTDATLKNIAERLRDHFLEDPAITQVDIAGTRNIEVIIQVPLENLRRHGITLQEIADKLRATAVELPGGGIKADTGEILVRVAERRDYGSEFGRIPIVSGSDGTQVRLADIAEITDGLEDAERFARYNGKPAVLLEIYRIGDQTPMMVSEAVTRKMEEAGLILPEGISMAIQRDMTDIYTQRAGLLIRNGALGLVLVLLLLGSFLELRLAVWVMMGIPISFLGSLLLMPLTGLSINMMTLFAFILCLGIVVDDAIVVGENIYRHHQEGLPFLKAAVSGVTEVAMPVGFSILTNMVAFLPLLVLPGIMGRILGMLPVVVICVFAISWLESLFILPAHIGHQRDRRTRRGAGAWFHARQKRFSDAFLAWVRNSYAPFLDYCLSHRYIVVAFSGALLAVTIGYVAGGRMGFEMFPRIESDYAYVAATLPYGSPVKRTEAVAVKLVETARKVAGDCGHPELITGIFADIGKSGTHTLDIQVFLADPEIRREIMSTEEFVSRWRKETGRIPGVEFMKFMSDRGGPGSGSALTVELAHYDIGTLERAATDMAAQLGDFDRVSDIDTGFLLGKEQLSFTIRPEALSLGLTARETARQVRNAYEGVEAIRQQRGRNEVKIRVRLPGSERASESDIAGLILKTPGGIEIPLREAVDVSRGRAYTSIAHRNGRRTMTVTCDVRPRPETGQIMARLDSSVIPALKAKYPGLSASYQGLQAESRDSMTSMKVTIPMVLLAIYILLAVPLRSYIQPAIIMLSIPFGLVGAVAGHLIMGYSLSLFSIIGIVALSGVVVNDSLVLVDFINNRLVEKASVREAVIEACIQRFRPIMLTTLTTFGGLAPMIFETSRQARFLIPMAISLGYGLFFATAIVILLVPSIYLVVEDIRSILARINRMGDRPGSPA